jgi:HCOMODA/2-hydroxy-3-carboxy-muconic semialdehyde decarboxylase
MQKRTVILAVLTVSIAFAQPPKRAVGGPNPALVNELVLANHILANQGVLDAYGHVSVRDDRNPNHFLLASHMAAGVVTASDIVEYDLDSKPVNPNAAAGYTERFIHGEIYRSRPDVMAIVHCHSPELIPFGATGVALRPIAHLAGFLGDGVPVFEIRDVAGETDLLIRDSKLGHALAQTLGQKPAALMRGHGAVVVAPNLHVVAGRAYYMNLDARLQREAMLLSGGNVTYLTPEEAGKASAQDGYERAWDYWKHELGVK